MKQSRRNVVQLERFYPEKPFFRGIAPIVSRATRENNRLILRFVVPVTQWENSDAVDRKEDGILVEPTKVPWNAYRFSIERLQFSVIE